MVAMVQFKLIRINKTTYEILKKIINKNSIFKDNIILSQIRIKLSFSKQKKEIETEYIKNAQ